MPRVNNNRTLDLPYRPGMITANDSTVEQLAVALWDELTKIAISMAGIDQPMGASVYDSEVLPISKQPTIVWLRIFDGATDAVWARPQSALNTATGVYTIVQEGVYNVSARLNVPAFLTPAIKEYYAGIRTTINYADGSPSTVSAVYNGGQDIVPINVLSGFLLPLTAGDSFFFEAAIDHETQTGSITAQSALQVQRVSGTGNNTR